MTATARNYKTKDVDMLITASTIIENAISNKTFLQSKRPTWTDTFLNGLKSRINTAIQTHLGVDSARDLRQATQLIYSVQDQALAALAEAKVQITEDFKSDKTRRSELLNQLGFTAYHRDARNGDQEALINLLYQFKTNLTPALTTEISAKGTPATLLQRIANYADTLKNADISQEITKSTRKTITANALKEFNEIYEQIISISKICQKFYKDQPHLLDQFNFAKLSKTLNHTRSISTDTPPTA